MFQQLSTKINATLRNLSGRGKLTEKNISDALEDLRDTLIEADAAKSVVDHFLTHVKQQALGQDILQAIKPGEMLVKIVYDELVKLLSYSAEQIQLDLRTKPPTIILVVGLQGAGKTTTVAKLAAWLQSQQKKTVMVCSTDIYRPAAMEQLVQLADQLSIPAIIADKANESPLHITKRAIKQAKLNNVDVLIIDTAGRSHIDQKMMAEVQDIHRYAEPNETLFVVDGMTGQDAANSAKIFKETFQQGLGSKSQPLTGVILTKMDGDQNGGAALSVCYVTKLPIKFIGSGEKITELDRFDPERIANLMLDKGDIIALVNQIEQNIDIEKTRKLEAKMKKGQLTLNELLEQIKQMKALGGPASLMKHLPGANQFLQNEAMQKTGDHSLKNMEALIQSMTPKERNNSDLLSRGSRKRRITTGSGTTIQDLNKLLKQFKMMQKFTKKFKGNKKKMAKMMAAMQGQNPLD